LIARSYARVVSGFLRDCAGLRRPWALRPKHRSHLEIAAGSASLASLFLKKLLALHRELPVLANLPFRYVYVMTDSCPPM